VSETKPTWMQDATYAPVATEAKPAVAPSIGIGQPAAPKVPTWDLLITEARLLQQPDLMNGGWINSGGFFDRSKAEWFNSEGAKGVPLAILYDVVVGRCIELEIRKATVDAYVTRRGRSILAEEAFFRLSFDARMAALRQGEAL
jgi:hypothetical protein